MPYRIDLREAPDNAFDRLVELGALDVEPTVNGLAALMPDAVDRDAIATALGGFSVSVSPATGRDDGSVWVLTRRPTRVGRFVLVPPGAESPAGAITLGEGPAFGTGLHPTTRLCLEALDQTFDSAVPASVLDVGTGSGILALAALTAGVPRAIGLDVEIDALGVAAENRRLNSLSSRLQLICGSVDAIHGTWPLVVANILTAPLIRMAPTLVRRVAHGGQLILSGVPGGLTRDVEHAYRDAGMRRRGVQERRGWTVIVFQPSW